MRRFIVQDLLGKVWELLVVYGIKIIAAVLVFIVGRWIAILLRKTLKGLMVRKHVEETLITFIVNMVYTALLAFVIIASLAQLNIQTTSFVAIIGAAGLAVGLALQGSLANFAAGVLMIIFRPFKVGDFIEGAGTAGIVEKVQIFTTQLKTPDNKTIIIPNAKLTGENIINYSAKNIRRVDLVFGIGYGDDIDKAKRVINEVLAKDERILDDPAPTVAVVELADSSVNFVTRPWVKTADYWDVYFAVTEEVKKQFDTAGVSIPFPQRDVHIYNHGE